MYTLHACTVNMVVCNYVCMFVSMHSMYSMYELHGSDFIVCMYTYIAVFGLYV